MTVGTSYQFTSLDENRPLPSCLEGKTGQIWSCCENTMPAMAVRPGKRHYKNELMCDLLIFGYFQMGSHSRAKASTTESSVTPTIPTMTRGL